MASNLYKIDGLQTSSNGLQPNSKKQKKPNSDGLQPKSDGIQPNSKRNPIAMASNLSKINGLQTSSNGLQPNSKRNLIVMAWPPT